MGNNNATASLTEEESSKSPLEPVSVKTTQDHVFLADEGKDGDGEIEKQRSPDGIGTPETEPQSKELDEELKVRKVEEEMHQSGLESLEMETVGQLQKQKSVTKGIETVCEEKGVEEIITIESENAVSKLITSEFGSEEKPCVTDETFLVTQSVYETVGTKEEKMMNESMEEIVPEEDVVKVDQENGLEHITKFSGIEADENQNVDVDVDAEVANEVKADQAISKPGSQETNQTSLEVDKEEKEVESGREASLKRMMRCKSLPVSNNIRVMEYSLAQQFVPEVVFPPGNKIGLEKPNTSETLLVSCVESKQTTEAITESNKEANVEIRLSNFGNDLKLDDSTEKTLLLCQDKTETYEAPVAVEEKTVMLRTSETNKTSSIELSLGLSMKPSERSKADDSFKETKGLEGNFLAKKASLGSMEGRVRKRSKSSLFGTCLCCNAAMN